MSALDNLMKELKDLNPNEISTIQKQVQALKRTRVSPLAYIEEMMNFQFVGIEEETNSYVHRMLITDELRNRYRILHGGITATFIDTAMGATVFQSSGKDVKAVTTDLQVRFVSPGEKGWLYAYTEVVKRGKTIILLETKVRDEVKKLIATATSTFFRIT